MRKQAEGIGGGGGSPEGDWSGCEQKGPFSARRKRETVLRLLRGELFKRLLHRSIYT